MSCCGTWSKDIASEPEDIPADMWIQPTPVSDGSPAEPAMTEAEEDQALEDTGLV